MSFETFPALIGSIMTQVSATVGGEEMTFERADGKRFSFYHSQDCCENVRIEDIEGDLSDLVGAPLLMAEEVSSEEGEAPPGDSYTWTFYKFATARGHVTVRWLGTSNGYYSESVSFEEVPC